jgi:eukaryotic-like serine/threonine-protein kinase
MDDLGQADHLVKFQGFELNLQTGELRKSGTRIRLQDQPFKVLAALVQRPGQLITREELRKLIWPEESFGDFDHAINLAVTKLRGTLGDSADVPHLIETLPRRGYRFIAPVKISAVENFRSSTHMRAWAAVCSAALLAVGLAVGGSVLRHRKGYPLTEKDTIVLADFTNTTGDPVFDDALRQGLEVQLQQSPSLTLVSEEQIRQTLQMMKQPPNSRLTPAIAREICQRANGAGVLESSIAQIGTQYDLILKAVNCSTGELLVGTEARASDKNQVLDGLGQASSNIREKLGESLATIQKFNTPLAQATTASLEALKAYSLGVSKFWRGDQAGAIPLFQQAIELDGNFAMAYVYLGHSYNVLGEYQRQSEPLRKAFALREHASEREKFEIVAAFHQGVTLQTEQAIQNCELWEQSYPRDFEPHGILGFENGVLGKYEQSAEEFRKAVELDPSKSLAYGGLLLDLTGLNRFAEAGAVYQEAKERNISTDELDRLRYLLAFVEVDWPMMEKLADSLSHESGYEGRILSEEAKTAAYFGHLAEARELSRRSAEKALSESDTGTAAGVESDASFREALFDNSRNAGIHAAAAMKLGGPPETYAMAVALANDTALAMKVVEQVASETRPGSFMDKETLGEFRGAIELKRGNPTRALEFLTPLAVYEGGWFEGYRPAYLRGEAYLLVHRGQEAAAEFQKIIDHRGIVFNEPFGALAHLQLARAYALQGDTAKARTKYQDFLNLWKDADPDIPILKQAKAEYARLQ